MRAHKLGIAGEETAAKYLKSKGYEILSTRFKRHGGEIDIVCSVDTPDDGEIIVFVEVKTRSPNAFGRPEMAVSRQKMKRIYRTAERFLHENPSPGTLCRFDVVAVYSVAGRLEVDHFKAAFTQVDLMDMD